MLISHVRRSESRETKSKLQRAIRLQLKLLYTRPMIFNYDTEDPGMFCLRGQKLYCWLHVKPLPNAGPSLSNSTAALQTITSVERKDREAAAILRVGLGIRCGWQKSLKGNNLNFQRLPLFPSLQLTLICLGFT